MKFLCLVIEKNGKVFFVKGGDVWSLPTTMVTTNEAKRAEEFIKKNFGNDIIPGRVFYRRFDANEFIFMQCEPKTLKPNSKARWLSIDELDKYEIVPLHKDVAAMYMNLRKNKV